ncbi:hypothetical protein B9N43_02935 [Denitratisoma sp. DHT3]|uniref:diguanylate cyclase domain-containing protein n=1 Tax=Denitratisoma sp. DHT3 TaxID=1981880 RepID=UPI00119894B8|nr:diguanylate cyclase [Denitratisoma sp. DHT3]QDX80310.1 hypothetical protein B9N43_02935 [Denitratisoma sp. DHT3]
MTKFDKQNLSQVASFKARHLNPAWRDMVSRGALVSIAYVLTGKLALLLAIPPGYASAIFPPAGLAIAAVYMWGRSLLVWVLLGSALLNLWAGMGPAGAITGVGAMAAAIIAIASALQASLGGWLLRRMIGYPSSFDQIRELLSFMLLTPAVCLVSATLSVSGLHLLGLVDAGYLAVNWLKWWVGDTLGVTVLFPILLIFFGEPRALWRSRRWTVALPMIGMLALSTSVFVKVSKWEQDDSLSVFRATARQFIARVHDSFRDQEFLISALAGFMSHDRTQAVSGMEFRNFASSFSLPFPVLQAMEWAPLVRAERRADFEAEQRRRIQDDFEIRERNAAGELVRAGERAKYFPIADIQPLEGNRSALGFDLMSTQNRRDAVAHAMNEGVPVATAPIKLVQEQARQSGILLLLKVREDASAPGLVVTVLRIGDFIARLMPEDKSILDVRLTDKAANKVIYGEMADRRSSDGFEQTLHFGAREYVLQVAPTETYLAQHQGWQSLVLHAAGLFGVSLLGAILLLGTGYTARVERLVEDRTAALATESRKNQIFLRRTGDALHILDTENRLVEASDSFYRMLGYDRHELAGAHASTWTTYPSDSSRDQAHLDERAGTFQTQYRRKDGSLLDVELTAHALELDGKSLISLSARDISERTRAEEEIRRLAFYDTLTGLPNRRLLLEQLGKALAQAKRYSRSMAVMFLDLDRFKNINDTLGHDVGDELLKVVGSRLTQSIRAGDTVARQGGDEFVIILTEISHPHDAEVVARKIIDALAKPVMLLGHERHTSTSIGIAVFPVSGSDDMTELMKKADIAMYEAKQAGRNCYRFFAKEMMRAE